MIKLSAKNTITPSPLARVFAQGIAIDDGIYFHLRSYRYRLTTEVHLLAEPHRVPQLQECAIAQWSISTESLINLMLPTAELNLKIINDIWDGGPDAFNLVQDAILSKAGTLKIFANQHSEGLRFVLGWAGREFNSQNDQGTGKIPRSWTVPAKQMASRKQVAESGQTLSDLITCEKIRPGSVLMNADNAYAVTDVNGQNWCWAIHLEGPCGVVGAQTEVRLEGTDRFLQEDACVWQKALPKRWELIVKKWKPTL